MNVLFLVHGLPVGGTEVQVSQLLRRLRGEGIGVFLGCLDEVGRLGEDLVREGYPLEVYGRRPRFDASLPVKIARSVKKWGIDIVHAHQYTCFFYGVLARLLARRRLIFTEHGRFYPDVKSWKRRAFNAVFARFCDRVTAVSRGVKESLARVEGFDPRAIEVIYNGVDARRFATGSAAEARKRLGIPPGASVVGTVGRLDAIKNQTLLIRGFERVREGLPGALLLVVGDGPERARLQALAAELGLDGDIRFLGQRDDIDLLLPAFDVFVLSSLSEGTPMTLLEAMASSTAIVSTAVGGIPEILEDGKEALLIDPSAPEPETLAACLRRVLLDRELAARLAGRARERFLREFTLDVVTAKYLAMYRELAGR
jgi:glycosyltransferase involved in cell wall biosynthesis